MKPSEIIGYSPLNETNQNHVAEIKKSILDNGWVGCPILVSVIHHQLITGSHRQEALQEIYDDWDLDFDVDSLGDVAEDVDDILEKYCEDNDCTLDEIDYGDIGCIFAGTWVEMYKEQIAEW